MNSSKNIIGIVFSVVLMALIVACKSNSKPENSENVIDQVEEREFYDTHERNSIFDTLLYENDLTKVYSDRVCRGDGVISISFYGELVIYNQDGSVYMKFNADGEFANGDKNPKSVIARYLVPLLDMYYFDADHPENDENEIRIYINNTIKILKKRDLDYGFMTWNEYLFSDYFVAEIDQDNIYRAKSILSDSTILAETVNINDCHGENIKSKEDKEAVIQWRTKNRLNIYFMACD